MRISDETLKTWSASLTDKFLPKPDTILSWARKAVYEALLRGEDYRRIERSHIQLEAELESTEARLEDDALEHRNTMERAEMWRDEQESRGEDG